MQQLAVHSTKYDGSLHYRYAVSVVRSEANLLFVYLGPGTYVESYRGELLTTRHSLCLYWTDRPYNLHVNWSADWRPYSHYINVATPAHWDANTLGFIDLDLDVIWKVDNQLIL